MLHHLGVELVDVGHKGRAARAGEEALFHQLLGLKIGHHVRAQGSLQHGIEAHGLQRRHHLAGGHGELAGDGRRHHRVQRCSALLLAVLEHLHHVQDFAPVHNGAEGALVHARPAADALALVNMGLLVFVHADGPGLAGALAGADVLGDCAVRAGLHAASAGNALVMVNHRRMVREGDSALGARIGAAVGNAAAACVADGHLAHRALVTGNGQHLHLGGVAGVSAHGHLHPLGDDGAFLVDAAAHGGLRAGNDGFRDVQQSLPQLVLPGQASHLTKYLVLQLLYVCVKLWHDILPPRQIVEKLTLGIYHSEYRFDNCFADSC